MGATNFPNGVTTDAGNDGNLLGYVTANGGRAAAGTVIVTAGSINVATGLDTVAFAVASPVGPLSSTAGTVGGFVSCSAALIGSSGGSICVRAVDQNGTVSVTAGTAAWFAIGS